ncbi:MAG: hypothetical protein AB7T06_19320 [Kofleriaceae bacterium]
MTGWKQAARAARLGAICALGPSLILFGWYFGKNHHLPLPWIRIAAISALLGMFTGAALGGCVQLLISASDRAKGIARIVANPITAGLVGGAIASVLAGVCAVAVFGSFRGPYVGTVESGGMLIAACASLATVLAVDARRGAGVGSIADLAPAFGRVILAAILVGGAAVALAVAMAPALFADGMFWTVRYAVMEHGPVTVGCVLGVLVGALFGAHLALSIWLARRAR